MAASPIRRQWQRIYRQTLTLTYKNLLIFYKTPISTIVRALIFPIVATIVLCELIHIDVKPLYNSELNGEVAASPSPIKDLDAAIKATSSNRLVFVQNGIPSGNLDPIINGIVQDDAMKGLDIQVIDDPNNLFTLCKQSLQGDSDCFAAIIFMSFNETNLEYSIVLDHAIANAYSTSGSANKDSLLTSRVLPLQWAIDSHIGNFSSSPKPFEQAWSGNFYSGYIEPVVEAPMNGPIWLALVGEFGGPIFILILIGVVYHLSVSVATERQTTMSELMQAQMVTDTPRIVCYHSVIPDHLLPWILDLFHPPHPNSFHKDVKYSPSLFDTSGWDILNCFKSLPWIVLRQSTTCWTIYIHSYVRPRTNYTRCNTDELFSIHRGRRRQSYCQPNNCSDHSPVNCLPTVYLDYID